MGRGEGKGACLVLLPQPLLQPAAPRGPRAPQALPRPCQCPPGAPHLLRRPPIPANLLGKGPHPRTLAPGWFLLWVRGQVGDLGLPSPGPSFIPTPDCEGPTTCLVLCCGCSKTTQAGSGSDESCAVRGKSRPGPVHTELLCKCGGLGWVLQRDTSHWGFGESVCGKVIRFAI